MTHDPRWWLSLGSLVLAACIEPERAERATAGASGSGGASSGGVEVEVDADAILARAMAYERELVRLTSEPEQSETHQDAASVQVWGTPEAAAAFSSIDPDDPTQEVRFEEATMFVKEHLDPDGNPTGLTLMYKAPAGYDASSGDWFWARVDQGEVTHAGRVDWCRNCHEVAVNSDFVVGFGKSP